MNIQCGKYIYSAILLALPRGGSVYPVIADFNDAVPPTPFAVYQRVSAEPNYTKSMFTGEMTHNYSVTVVDNQYTSTLEHAQAVVNNMLALSYTVKTDMRFGQVLLTDISEDYVDGLFLQTLNFEINTIEILQ